MHRAQKVKERESSRERATEMEREIESERDRGEGNKEQQEATFSFFFASLSFFYINCPIALSLFSFFLFSLLSRSLAISRLTCCSLRLYRAVNEVAQLLDCSLLVPSLFGSSLSLCPCSIYIEGWRLRRPMQGSGMTCTCATARLSRYCH